MTAGVAVADLDHDPHVAAPGEVAGLGRLLASEQHSALIDSLALVTPIVDCEVAGLDHEPYSVAAGGVAPGGVVALGPSLALELLVISLGLVLPYHIHYP